jgi:hypothetical protein
MTGRVLAMLRLSFTYFDGLCGLNERAIQAF